MFMLKNKILTILLLPLLLVSCTSAFVPDTSGDSALIVGEVYTLENGERMYGNLAVIGSNLTLERDSIVYGEISLIGSTADIEGTVVGNVYAFAGSTMLGSSATVNGDFNQLFHHLKTLPGAHITGETNTYISPFTLRTSWDGFNLIFPFFSNPQWLLLSRLIFSAAFCLLVCLIVLVAPRSTRNVMKSIQNQPGISFGVGFLFFMTAPVISIILAITICLAPLAVVLLVVFLIATVYGWIAMASIIGEKICKWLYLDLPLVLQALLGALLVAMLISLISLIPCIGLLAAFIFGCYGFGGVISSRFGKRIDSGSKTPTKPKVKPSAPKTE